MKKVSTKALELGVAAPNPKELAQAMGRAEQTCVTGAEMRAYLGEHCGTVMECPTTDGRWTAVFEFAGEFHVTGAFADPSDALAVAVVHVSQR